jgi:signal peptidase II
MGSIETVPQTTSNLRSRPAVVVMLLTMAVLFAVDLLTKYWATGISEPIKLIPGWLHLTYVRNFGAAFGAGQGGRWVFVGVSAVAVFIILRIFGSGPRRWWYWLIHGALLAGVLGNLYDRITLGYVRDMIHALPGFHWGGSWHIPLLNYPLDDPFDHRAYFPWVFNVADSLLCISIGAMLAISIFVHEDKAHADGKPEKP